MNYRHIYHAGNFADVFKHIVLMLLVEYLKQKDKAFFVLDTHAGTGFYDLSAEEAQKTKEADHGIAKIWSEEGQPEAVERYLAIVRKFNDDGVLRRYPGSPKITQSLLRNKDRLAVNELHPEDVLKLRKVMGDDARVSVGSMDGYTAMKALLPPEERRGLVLIDPPFEVINEFDLMVKALEAGHKRWATGMYAFWYPIKGLTTLRRFHKDMEATGIPKIAAADFLLRPATDPDQLNGCGMLLVNAPWTMKDELKTIMAHLTPALTGRDGRYSWTDIS